MSSKRIHPIVPLSLLLAACAPSGAPSIPSTAAPSAPPAAAPSIPRPAGAPPSSRQVPPARWLALELAGEPAGRTREVVEPLADGGARTRVTSEVRLGRLGKVLEMGSDVTFDEDRDGGLRAVHMRTTLSRQTTTSEVSIDRGTAGAAGGAGGVGTATIRESAGGPAHTRTLALAEPLRGPEAIRRGLAAELTRPGEKVEYLTWSPTLSAPQRVQYTAEASETRAIAGAPRQLLRVKVAAEGDPPRVAWLDAHGREARSEIAMPFGMMVASEASAEPTPASGEMRADLFAKTLIRSNVRLPRARSLEKLVLQVTLDDPAVQLSPLESADVRITQRDAAGAVIEIERVRVPARPTAEDAIAPELLGAGAIIDPTDPQVRAIASSVIAGAADPWERAQRLTRWVTEHMTFDAGVLFAPAAELARDRRGTCAGYAVLLAALLRAADIPARVDLGLVYVGGVFAGHAWVEARIRGRWVPLDAAIPSDGAADAARLAFGRDALDKGPGALFAAFGQMLGRAKLRVLSYTPAGRPAVRVDDTAPYAVDGARYRNRGLGLSIEAPAGYRFTTMDAVWPDRTVVALEGAGGRVTFAEGASRPGREPAHEEARALDLASAGACERRSVAGHRACAARRDGFAGVAFADGPSLYIIEARGPQPQALLDAVARTVRLDDARR
jgi:transglutaminase-like putative cysteine protease